MEHAFVFRNAFYAELASFRFVFVRTLYLACVSLVRSRLCPFWYSGFLKLCETLCDQHGMQEERPHKKKYIYIYTYKYIYIYIYMYLVSFVESIASGCSIASGGLII